ncbi:MULTISPECIES: xylose ABC transporter ATP-binding protein [Pasteurellaceae]|uniref:Xylose ABC transporter ATP-binding protein n=1 Tax=Pasteurella atlantica TaxID=2827233 RepID=A0AAW8CG96_9PAST|nr:xylose ABC transporter ATP-binding protein [Pasteurella atlantica]MBR0573150.1 xylose ABC transporter ATP-binding protein [Pasteurella atlantica]MDP8038993.1 xylose ABC transporter ATP-binding protein [Pasteurella atlantica]MDP8041083.1 xylose ABC transporter ATP-binding protein [Pasteurella atlantica]MDP8043304.1 xylose ABC transporter ATP-binding protein [Pasteurella atlantica]MDP8045390.1 xylose ABC transporter ATP-binding protein [Pasteurella atlantica]
MTKLLEMKNITKKFGDVIALNNISISLSKGEILSLCGENGSGKSTLMKVLCGIYPYGEYDGEIYFSNHKLEPKNIKDTEEKGISIIHQELTLVKNMSVVENIFLGNEISNNGITDDNQMYLKCKKLLQSVELNIDPNTKVGELGIGQQQLVEIAKALNKKVQLLILDEPTSSLTEKETKVLLNLIKNLKVHNIACIYISHKLNEVKEISDNICIIRDGEHIGTYSMAAMSEDDIITKMVGREITSLYPREEHQIGEEILRIENLTAYHPINTHIKRLDHINFNLCSGEILGIAGLVGSRRTEMAQCIFGSYEGKYNGDILIDNQKVTIKNCSQAIKHKIVMVPEDRKKHGIISIMEVGKNITLSSLKEYSFKNIINNAKEETVIQNSIEKLKVKTSSPKLAIGRLSGGNQQKAILAKCLLLNPNILILDEPTRGIDVGAKYEIYKLIYQLAQKGIGIIVISSELPEVLGISDRILVMHEGQIKANLINHNLTQEKVMEAALKE